jgi:hypothetical protein
MNEIEQRNVVNSSFSINVESVRSLQSVTPEEGALVMFEGKLHFSDGKDWYVVTSTKVRL